MSMTYNGMFENKLLFVKILRGVDENIQDVFLKFQKKLGVFFANFKISYYPSIISRMKLQQNELNKTQ